MIDADTLHRLVTAAIWRAERLQDAGAPGVESAWKEVSGLEELLATAIPASEPDGRIARRGAVRAALKSADPWRAEELAHTYTEEADGGPELAISLRQILDEDAEAFAQRYPHAASRYGVAQIREQMRLRRQAGPFWLAAA